jgi:acyl carrier protein
MVEDEWFVRRGTADQIATVDSLRDQNMFESGLVDSFGVIELITDVEKRFCIEFSERDFQDRRFPYIRGLAEMIRSMQRRELA